MATAKATAKPKPKAKAKAKPKAKKKAAPKKASTKAATKAKGKTMSDKAVVVDGVRTPFVRAFGPYLEMDTIALGDAAVNALLDKTGISRNEVDAVVWGGVILPPTAPNVAREIAIDCGLPAAAESHTVTRACASGLQAITTAISMIDRGEADVVIAGGSESTSNATVAMPSEVVHAFAPIALGKNAGPADYLDAVKQLWPFNNVLPKRPQIAERTTGELMGESAEKMAEINNVSRQSQDELALASHQRAAAAAASGRFDDEICTVITPSGETVEKDGLVRGDTTMEKLGRLRAAFKEGGTLSAGNSSALTDGASCVLLMSESKAKELGYKPRARVRSWSYVGVDPADQLLMGPAIAMPQALERAGLTWDDVDFVDMHEAFAAQVLSVVSMLESDVFAKERLGKDKAVTTKVDLDKMNLHGGSLAIGHPFGATGARMVTTVANELAAGKNGKVALLGLCAAGGLGAAAVMEAID